MKSVRPRIFTDENIALMRSMAKDGKTPSQIAERIGSTAGSVRVLGSRLGIRFRRRVFHNDNVALMRTMASEGKSVSQIAEKIHSTPGSVRVLASRLGIRLRSRDQGKPVETRRASGHGRPHRRRK
jgi:hypothetical protein